MNKIILFLTSTYPFGLGEGFIEPELFYLSQDNYLFIMPTYPRGYEKSSFIQNKHIIYINEPLLSFNSVLSSILFGIKQPKSIHSLLKLCKDKSIKKTIRNMVLIPKALKMATLIQQKEIHFIYAHWLSAPTQLALLLNQLTGIPFAATGHRWDLIDQNNFQQKFEKASFIRLISQYSKKLLPPNIYEQFSHKIHTIYMGINIPQHNEIKKIKPQVIKGVCIANLIEVKGHSYLLQAIKTLKDNGLIVEMDLFGTGELKNQLVEQCQQLQIDNQIHFMGNVNHQQLLNKLSTDDYYFCCLPSLDLGNGLHEGIPVALMEAMAYKIPCISTHTGSIHELIENEKTGLLVQDKNSDLLAQAIQNMIENQKLREKIVDNAYNLTRQSFNAEDNNKTLCSLIMKNCETKK